MFKDYGREEMRISDTQVQVLKNKLYSLSTHAKLYLFGSRVYDEKKGGDIDLLVIDEKLTEKDLRLLRVDFFKHFGEQKLDILLDDGELNTPFVQHIFTKAVLL